MKRNGYINNVEIFLLLLLECFDASRTDYQSSYCWLKIDAYCARKIGHYKTRTVDWV